MEADDDADDVLTTNNLRPHTVSGDFSGNPLKTRAADDADDDLRTQSAKASDDEPVCRRCGVPATDIFGPLVPCGANGSAGQRDASLETFRRIILYSVFASRSDGPECREP
jgi:hypothetical protein